MLRIRIGGLNQIAHLRGVRSCTYPILQTREGFAAAVCELELIPNVESDMMPEVWSSMASACRTSMDTRMLPYLETFAENRAFGRAVKRALQINILSDIEVGGDAREMAAEDARQETAVAERPAPGGFDPLNELEKACRNHRDGKGNPSPISFEALKAAAIKLNAENPPSTDPAKPAERTQGDPALWTAFTDIQPIDAWLLLGRMERKKEAAKAAAEPKAKPTTKRAAGVSP